MLMSPLTFQVSQKWTYTEETHTRETCQTTRCHLEGDGIWLLTGILGTTVKASRAMLMMMMTSETTTLTCQRVQGAAEVSILI